MRMMRYWYERAVDEQKPEIRQYRKKQKSLDTQVEPVPRVIEVDLSQSQGDKPEPIEAQ